MQKEKVFAAFTASITERLRMIQANLDDLKEMGKNETKSTAGDKHETALAMVQLEQEKLRGQLKAARQQLIDFSRIDPHKTSPVVHLGSLVFTDKGVFLVSLALGKIQVDGISIMALSPQSPLGEQLVGLQTGGKVVIRSTVFTIESVL
jgi:transcription elongation GreA/GreB family factor